MAFLSHERLKTLIEQTGAESRAIDLHRKILVLWCELAMLIAVVEVGLGNTVVENLTQRFQGGGWLQRSPGNFRWRTQEDDSINKAIKQARRAAYAKPSQAQKADLDTKVFPSGRNPRTPHRE